MLIMNGRVFCTPRALFQHGHRCSALPQRFQGRVSLLTEPVLCCLAALSHLPSLLSRKTSPAATVCPLCHTCSSQTSQVRECPGEPYSSFPVSCCLSVFLYLLNMKGSSSWEPDLCQDVVAWGCVVSLGVVHWCLGTCAADVGPSSHGNGKQREALLIVPGSLLRNMVMIEVYSIAELVF